jgi:hypothetical protein
MRWFESRTLVTDQKLCRSVCGATDLTDLGVGGNWRRRRKLPWARVERWKSLVRMMAPTTCPGAASITTSTPRRCEQPFSYLMGARTASGRADGGKEREPSGKQARAASALRPGKLRRKWRRGAALR